MSVHHEELQELENAKYYWNKYGKWIFALLVAGALAYLGKVIWQNHQDNQAAQAAAEAATLVHSESIDTAKLKALQEQHPDSFATAQATMQAGTQAFNNGKYAEAAAAYQWVIAHQQTPLLQASAMQNLAAVYLQEKKYDDALKTVAAAPDAAYEALFSESRGDIYAAQGKIQEAAQAYKAAMDKLQKDSVEYGLIELKAELL